MDEKEKKIILASIDIAVSIFIIILGFLVILFGLSWGDWVITIYYGPPWLDKTTLIIIIIGIALIIYGFKRFIKDLIS